MRTIRAKFYCSTVKDDGGQETVQLSAVYGTDEDDNRENNQFSQATPWGDLTMGIDNPGAQGFFEEGKEYYLDFSIAKNSMETVEP